jgi:hypothetical protein
MHDARTMRCATKFNSQETRVSQAYLASTRCIALVRKRFCERLSEAQKMTRERGESRKYATKKFSWINPDSTAATPSRGISRTESRASDSHLRGRRASIQTFASDRRAPIAMRDSLPGKVGIRCRVSSSADR